METQLKTRQLHDKQEHRTAGQYTPKGLYQKMGAKFRLLKHKRTGTRKETHSAKEDNDA